MKKEVGTDTREMEWVIDAAWSARGYARERRKIMTDQHSEPLSGGIGDRTESPVRSRAASRRPGVLTFAAVIIRDLTPTGLSPPSRRTGRTRAPVDPARPYGSSA
jgi:hypothetical protein